MKAGEKARKGLSEDKSGSLWLAMMDLSDFIVWSGVAKAYFSKGGNWLLQRLHGYEVNGKPARLKSEEYTVFVSALRDIANKLNEAADRIEKAAEDEE